MTALGRLWRGELELATAFWNWAVFGGLIVNVSSSAFFLFLIVNGHPIFAILAGYAFSIPYNIIASVGVWRSAARHPGDPNWANVARIVTIIGMVFLSVT
jgi:hypothetical protein